MRLDGPRDRFRRRRRSSAVVAGVLVWLALTPGPAVAHETRGSTTNYLTRFLAVVPPAPDGVTVRVLETGNRLEIRNGSRKEVIVLGYQGEPFLRLTQSGAYQNAFSPSVVRSSTRRGSAPPTERTDIDAEPVWDRISNRSSARWFDHRIHKTSGLSSRGVREDPGRRQVVSRWAVPLLVEGKRLEARGELLWVPGPNPLPWLAIALGAGVVAVTLSHRRGWSRGLSLVLTVLLVVDALDATAFFVASISAGGSFVSAPLIVPAYAVTGYALSRLRKGDEEGLGWAVAAGVAIAYLGGFRSIGSIRDSQLAMQFPGTVARVTAMISLGLGLGVAVAAMRARRTAGRTVA